MQIIQHHYKIGVSALAISLYVYIYACHYGTYQMINHDILNGCNIGLTAYMAINVLSSIVHRL